MRTYVTFLFLSLTLLSCSKAELKLSTSDIPHPPRWECIFTNEVDSGSAQLRFAKNGKMQILVRDITFDFLWLVRGNTVEDTKEGIKVSCDSIESFKIDELGKEKTTQFYELAHNEVGNYLGPKELEGDFRRYVRESLPLKNLLPSVFLNCGNETVSIQAKIESETAQVNLKLNSHEGSFSFSPSEPKRLIPRPH